MPDRTAPHPSSPEPDANKPGISRRGFLKGAGLTAAGTALLDGVQAFSREAAAATTTGVSELGPGPVPVRLKVNGKEHAVEIEPRTTLADALRMHLGMTGTKVICDRGACSGCTVWLDKMPVNSCMPKAALSATDTTCDGIDDNWSVLVGQSFSESVFHVVGLFETDAFCPHCFGNAREIRILEIHSKGNEARLLLLNIHEVERFVVEDDVHDARLELHEGGQIAEREHRETAIAAEGNRLPAGEGQL